MAIYSEIYKGPPKSYGSTSAKKRYIAIHNTSNNATAEAESSYARNRTDSVSSHYYIDNNSIIQSLDTKNRAFHAGSQVGNTYAIAYEITGTNDKSRDWWMKNVAWDLLAKQIAKDMEFWNIQNKHLTVSEMQRGGISGIVTHNDMRRAWGGTTHTDPGEGFPVNYLISKINQYLSGGSGGGGEIPDNPFKENEMLHLAREENDKRVYVGNGVVRRWVKDQAELENVQYWVKNKFGGDPEVNIFKPGTISVLGVLVGDDGPTS